jgi:hypothetical protein
MCVFLELIFLQGGTRVPHINLNASHNRSVGEMGMRMHFCNPSTQEAKGKIESSRPAWAT